MQNFTPIGVREWERGPQNGKNFHILVKNRPAGGEPFDQLLGAFICATVLH